MSFLSTLKERRLPQFAAAYTAGGWVLLQLVDQLVDRGVAPDPVYPTALVVFICGAPAAVILSWFHGAPGSQRFRPLELSLLAALGVITVGVSAFVWRSTAAGAGGPTGPLVDLPPTEDPRRIAVLYFESRGDEDVRFLASGLTESLIDELSAVEALHVVSRNGVAPYRKAVVPPDSVGRALEVGTIVEGRVAASGERLRVNVSLVNATTGGQYGDVELERARAELFDLQDDLAREVALRLREKLGDEIQILERQAEISNVEAWELLQRAAEAVSDADQVARGGDLNTAESLLARADSLLVSAQALEAGWVRPAVERGRLDYRRSRITGFDDRSAADGWIGQGLEHAEVALALQPDDADALELRGTLRYWKFLLNLGGGPAESGRLVAGAEADLRASVSANPQQASAWSSLSHLLANQDRVPEAKLAAIRSYESDPYLRNAHLTLWRLFFTSFDLGDGVEARRWCEEGRRRFPDHERFRLCGILVYALPDAEPDVAGMWARFDEFIELSHPDDREFNRHRGQMTAAMALVRAGLPDSARSVAVRARAGADLDPTRDLAYWEAVVRSLLGDIDEALNQLSIHLAANPGAVEGSDQIWYLEELRKDPRFESISGAP